MPTPTLKRSPLEFTKSPHKRPARVYTPVRPAKNTFSKHINKRVKSYNPRTGQKHTFSSKQQSKQNVRVNDKKFTCQCQKIFSHDKSHRSQKTCNYPQSHKTPKNLKHPGLGLKVDLKPVPATSHHAWINTLYVIPGSKLAWVPKLTT